MSADGTRVYLDWNAEAPMRPRVREALVAALGRSGNASSVHAEGRAARARIEAARSAVAALAGAEPGGVTFTSGGTEANVTVLAPNWTSGSRPLTFDRLLVSAVEHPSVAKGGRFPANRVETIGVDRAGVLDVAALTRRLSELSAAGERPLVSVMVANNETGVLQPIGEIAEAVHAVGGLVHADAVQAAGRVDLDEAARGADVVTLSAHKIGGPQGVGAVVRRATIHAFPPLIVGGGQENWSRAGTEPVALIEAFGLAAEAARDDLRDIATVRRRRDAAESAVLSAAPDAIVFSGAADRLANTLAFAVPGVRAETAVIALDLAGVAVSSGSACSSGKVRKSDVLVAMGYDADTAAGGIRVSLGPTTSDEDIERFAEAFAKVHARLTGGKAPRAA